MGAFFSKSKPSNKVAPSPVARQSVSAPAGSSGLDGTSPGKLECRLSDPGQRTAADGDISPQRAQQRDPKVGVSDQTDCMGPLPEEAQHWAKIFGEATIRSFLSSDWKDREQSLIAIGLSLRSPEPVSAKKTDVGPMYAAACEMLARTLLDKVAPIFHASLELVSQLLSACSQALPQHALRTGMQPLMPILVHRCGNLNSRIHEASLQTLLSVASFSSFGCGFVGSFAMAEPSKRGRDASQAAQMYGRLDLMHGLLEAHRDDSDLAVEEVLKLSRRGLDMPDDKVRQAAIKVIVEVLKVQKAAGYGPVQLETYFGALKPALIQMLLKKCEDAGVGDGFAGSQAAGLASGGPASRKLPAISDGMGFKALGKALPPISSAMRGSQVANRPGAMAWGVAV